MGIAPSLDGLSSRVEAPSPKPSRPFLSKHSMDPAPADFLSGTFALGALVTHSAAPYPLSDRPIHACMSSDPASFNEYAMPSGGQKIANLRDRADAEAGLAERKAFTRLADVAVGNIHRGENCVPSLSPVTTIVDQCFSRFAYRQCAHVSQMLAKIILHELGLERRLALLRAGLLMQSPDLLQQCVC